MSDILFDAWALTTIRDKLPGRPPVEPYLHGVAEWQPPETHVAWREEVGRIVGPLLEEYTPKDLLEDYPLKPHELLRDNSKRVFERLQKLKAGAETPVWVVADDDSVKPTTLGELIDAGKEEIERKTVLLPPSAGGLAGGFLVSDSPDADDVADEWYADAARTQRRRIRAWDHESVPVGMRRIRKPIDIHPDTEEAEEEATSRRLWYWYELAKGGDGDGSKNTTGAVLWAVHTKDVTVNTTASVAKLPLPDELKQALIFAAECHDLGKKRKLFQTVLGNTKYPGVALAKSGKKGGRVKETYRHEFGSLLDTEKVATFATLSEELKAFVLHVIATHHGRGRPHFPADEAFDPERSDDAAKEVAREVPRRFAKLQRKYGRWGLAYLESLLRAADYAASANPSEFVKEAP